MLHIGNIYFKNIFIIQTFVNFLYKINNLAYFLKKSPNVIFYKKNISVKIILLLIFNQYYGFFFIKNLFLKSLTILPLHIKPCLRYLNKKLNQSQVERGYHVLIQKTNLFFFVRKSCSVNLF